MHCLLGLCLSAATNVCRACWDTVLVLHSVSAIACWKGCLSAAITVCIACWGCVSVQQSMGALLAGITPVLQKLQCALLAGIVLGAAITVLRCSLR